MVADIRKHLSVSNDMKDKDSKILSLPNKFKVTEIRQKKNGFINPVIVSFQNGKLNDHQLSTLKVSLTDSKNGRTNVEVETSYGHIFKNSHSSNSSLPKGLIAIRNRKTHKVKIVEVDSAILINSALLQSPVANKTETDHKKEIKNLYRTFGGKKIMIRSDQRDKLNISSMPVADEVKKAVEEMKVEDISTSQKEAENDSIMHLLPPCHRDAATVSGVYVLNEILLSEELEELKKEVQKRKENKFNPKDYSEFYVFCYNETKQTTGHDDVKLAGILFAEILIQFLKIPHKKLTAKNVILCPFSSLIHNKLLNEFCLKTDMSVSRPMSMRDKCLCYIIAISLICCDYKVNLKLLSTTCAVHLARLIRLAQIVGAVATPKEGIFVLKLPLAPLPKVAAKRPRRK